MKASHVIKTWQPRKLLQWEKKAEHCNYTTHGIDHISVYPSICSGFKYGFGSLRGKSDQNASQTLCWSTHHLVLLPSQRDLIVYAIFWKSLCHFHKGMNVGRLFKVCTWYRNFYTSDRKFARRVKLWHSLMFQL